MVDVDALIAPIDGDAPCGPDLRGDQSFIDIEEKFAAYGKPQKPDEAGAAPPEPPFANDRQACFAYFAKSKDVMPLIVAAHISARIDDLEGVRDCIFLLERLVTEFWGDFHPCIPEDDGSPMLLPRMNEVSLLGSAERTLALPLARMRLVALPAPSAVGFSAQTLAFASKPIGEWSDEQQAALDKAVAGGALTLAASKAERAAFDAARQLRSIMRVISPDAQAKDSAKGVSYEASELDAAKAEAAATLILESAKTQLALIEDIAGSFEKLSAEFVEKAGEAPSLGAVVDQVARMREAAKLFIDAFTPPVFDDVTDEAGAEETGEGGMAAVNGDAGGGGSAGVFRAMTPRTRQDVAAAMDAICAYYQTNEPGSPVLPLIKRARGWIDLDFLSLIKEIAPSSAGDVEKFLAMGGAQPEE